MNDNSDAIGRWLFIGMCIGAAVYLAANGLACRPAECSAFWFGDAGYAGTIIGGGTLAAAIVAGQWAARSYRLNRQASLASRYQTGVELLARENDIEYEGGIAILIQVQREDAAYVLPVAGVLNSAILHRGAGAGRHDPIIGALHWPAIDSTRALAALGSIDLHHRWQVSERRRGSWKEGGAIRDRMDTFGAYLNRVGVWQVDFRKIDIRGATMRSVTFDTCNFSGCRIEATVHDKLHFRDCDLRSASLVVECPFGATITTERCLTDAATLNGLPLPANDQAALS